ncbi:MAG: MFS transporter [Candidatus Methylopumilus sp.]|nr:MFS transporter [Candidatus Methylopumilus sp.]
MKSFAPSAMMLSVAVVSALVLNAVPILAPVAAEALSFSPEWIGYFISIVYVAGMLSALVSGNFIVRYGSIRVSQLGLALCALGLALVASGNLTLIVLGALIMGIGYGPISPASSHVLGRTTSPERRSLAFSIRQTGNPIAGFLAGLAIPVLVVVTGWKITLFLVAALSMVFIWVAEPFRQELDNDRLATSPFSLSQITQPIKLVFMNRDLRELGIVSFVFCGLQMILTSYLVTYLTLEINISFVAAGFVLAMTQLVSVFARVFWGWVADRFLSPRKVMVILGVTMAACAVLTGILTATWSYGFIMLLMTIFGASAIGWNGVYMAEVARVSPPGMIASTTGASLFFTYLGGIVCPSGFAFVIMATGSYQYGFIIFGLLALVASLILLFSKKQR